MPHFKRRWTETRGDEFDAWGCSLWYIETDPHGYPVRQLMVYDNGNSLTYDHSHQSDRYGQLGDQAIDVQEFAQFSISSDEFDAEWNRSKPVNR